MGSESFEMDALFKFRIQSMPLPIVSVPLMLTAIEERRMTEHEWLTSADPAVMLRHLTHERTPDYDESQPRAVPLISARKLRLFACNCCRACWSLLTDPRSRRAVEVAERFADGEATAKELSLSRVENCLPVSTGTPEMLVWFSNWAEAVHAAERCASQPKILAAATQAAILREIAGNPFWPVWAWTDKDHAWTSNLGGTWRTYLPRQWLTPDVLLLAQAAYEERPGRECGRCNECVGGAEGKCCCRIEDGALDPQRLAVLADCLEEAGCTDCDILNHLRSPGPHYRGCWVLDRVLGKG